MVHNVSVLELSNMGWKVSRSIGHQTCKSAHFMSAIAMVSACEFSTEEKGPQSLSREQ